MQDRDFGFRRALYKVLPKIFLVMFFSILFFSASGQAAPAFKAGTANSWGVAGWGESGTQSYAVTAGTNQALLVWVVSTHGGTVSSVTYNGTGMTLVGSIDAGNSTTLRAYILVNPPVGTANIVVTNGNGQGYIHFAAAVYEGVHQTTPIGNTASATTSGTDPMVSSVSHTRSSNDSTVVIASAAGWNPSYSGNNANVGTQRFHANAGGEIRSFAFSDFSPGSTGTTTLTHTRTGSGWSGGGIYALELMPAGPAGSPTRTPTRTRTPTSTPVFSPTRTRTPTPVVTPTFTRTISPTFTRTRTPTHTPNWTATRSPTPAPASPTRTLTPITIPMNKTINVASATIGDTITYCISWQNNTGGSASVSIWDTVPISMAYLSCWRQSGAAMTGCTYTPRLATFNFGTVANGANGVVCFNAVITGYPWLPGEDLPAWLAWLAREEDADPWGCARTGGLP